MSQHQRRPLHLATCGFPLLIVALAVAARAEKFDLYVVRPDLQTTFPDVSLPPRAQGPTVFGALADGRIVAVTTVDDNNVAQDFSAATPAVYVQGSVGGDFVEVGALPLDGRPWTDYGGSFLAVSPSDSRVAVGNNSGSLAVFSGSGLSAGTGVPTPSWFDVGHSTGAWLDNQTLALTGFNFSTGMGNVTILDTATLALETAVTGIGASAGIAFDADGNLYTAEGYSAGGKPTGQVRRFDRDQWQDAVADGLPLGFQSDLDGEDVVAFSSASSLAFDDEGNLIVGGGRFDMPLDQSNSFAIYRPSDGAQREFDPNDTDNANGNFYNVIYNLGTGEIYANEPFGLVFGGPVDSQALYVVSVPAVVPEPQAWALLLSGLASLLFWTLSRRKRSNSIGVS